MVQVPLSNDDTRKRSHQYQTEGYMKVDSCNKGKYSLYIYNY